MSTALAGTRLLVRHQLRRDRVLVSVWVAVLVLLCLASAAATPSLYADTADRVRAATALNDNPAIVALYGPVLDVTSVGELAMTKMTVLYALFVAILFVTIVRRHTRVEEESGRAELIGGTAVGRHAPLASALTESAVVALGLGLLTTAANTLGGLDATGSLAFGSVWAGTGLVAAGVGAVASQLSASARTTAGFAAAIIGVLYVLRAVGDTSAPTLSWLTPFGWNTQVSAYSDPRWWVLSLYPVATVGLVAGAVALRSRRDLGAGLFAARPGPSTGSPRLADALALTLRLHTPALLTWSFAVAALGTLFGFIAPGIDDLLGSEASQEFLGRLGGTLIAAVLSMMAIVVAFFTVQVVGHAGSDEAAGRAEMVLATATSRSRWFGATIVVAAVGSAWLLVVAGVALWAGYLAADGPAAGEVLAASLVWIPAVWVVGALAGALLAGGSRWSVLAWALPPAFLVVTLVGDLLELPSWVRGVSPFDHVPQLPADAFSWRPEAILTLIAGAVTAAAWWRFRTRDVG